MQTTLIRRTTLATVGMACTVMTPLALAHAGAGLAPHDHEGMSALSSFWSGALHPMTGLDHLAAMVSVGLWSSLGLSARAPSSDSERAFGQMPSMLAAPIAFAATLLLGALLGMSGLQLPGVEPMIAASLLVLGLLVATRLRLNAGLGAALVAMFALFHGLAHGSELGGHAAASLSGMVLGTALLHGLGMGLGLALKDQRQPVQRWLPRLAGLGVASLGMSLLAPAIAAAI